MSRFWKVLVLAFIAQSLVATSLDAATLYDGSLGTMLEAQGWTYMADNGALAAPASVTRTWTAGATRVDTTAPQADRAGFSRTDQTLNRTLGYTIELDLRLLAEAHTGSDRAGFSLIALSSDKRGIELAFWNDRIFAQKDSPIFTQGESTPLTGGFDATALHTYLLTIQGNAYTLASAGMPTLSGALRDYSSFATPPYSVVYNTPNLIFLGDDTTSAEARFDVAGVRVQAIPEPTAFVMAAGMLLIAISPRNRRRASSHSNLQ